jgi:hypothetical protein
MQPGLAPRPPEKATLPVYCDDHDALMIHDIVTHHWVCPRLGCRVLLSCEEAARLSQGDGVQIRVTK